MVNQLLFNKCFGTCPITPLHNLYLPKPIFTSPKEGWLAKGLVTDVKLEYRISPSISREISDNFETPIWGFDLY